MKIMKSRPEEILNFFMLNSTEHEISTADSKINIFCFKLLTCCINIKMPTVVGILTFMSRINCIGILTFMSRINCMLSGD